MELLLQHKFFTFFFSLSSYLRKSGEQDGEGEVGWWVGGGMGGGVSGWRWLEVGRSQVAVRNDELSATCRHESSSLPHHRASHACHAAAVSSRSSDEGRGGRKLTRIARKAKGEEKKLR